MNEPFTTTLVSLFTSREFTGFLDRLSEYLENVNAGNLDSLLRAGKAVATDIAWLIGPIDAAINLMESGDAASWAKILALTEYDEFRYTRLLSLSRKFGGTWREFVTVVRVAPDDPPVTDRMLLRNLEAIIKRQSSGRPEGAYALIMGLDDLRILRIVELSEATRQH